MIESPGHGRGQQSIAHASGEVDPVRRALLAAGIVGMLAGAKGLPAPGPLQVPVVDNLRIQVITDNAAFGPFLSDLSLPGMRVIRTGGGIPGAARMSAHALMAEFGLSLLASSKKGEDVRKVMVDFGYSAEVLANNLALLNIEATTIDAAVLSHGHLDHYGGLPACLAQPRRPAISP